MTLVQNHQLLLSGNKDIALRDLKDLIEKDILQKEASGVRRRNYKLKWK